MRMFNHSFIGKIVLNHVEVYFPGCSISKKWNTLSKEISKQITYLFYSSIINRYKLGN